MPKVRDASAARPRKPFVLLLLPGPMYRVRDALSERLAGLSRDFDGAVITTTTERQAFDIGSFRVIPLRDGRGLLPTMAAFVRSIRNVVRERRKKGGIDLVVTYDPLKTGLLGLFARALSGARHLCEVNGDYANAANYVDIEKPWLRVAKRWAYIRVERFVLRRADGIKLLYEGQLEQLRINTGDKIVRALPNLVKTGRFSPKPPEPVILTAGFPAHVKGIDVLIEAFKSLYPDFPEWRLKILGHYPRREGLDALLVGVPRVEIRRAVPAAEMPEHIGRCGIFVLASRTEGMGRVLVEAMAAGRPRIGTSVGGIPSVIEHEYDGLLVPPNNPSALAEALRRLLRDRGLREELGRNARERAKRFFADELYFAKTAKLYNDVISMPSVSDDD